jgi:gamma-glutamyl:cysteine ligase YbdK (ATP-grasp superfamily)
MTTKQTTQKRPTGKATTKRTGSTAALRKSLKASVASRLRRRSAPVRAIVNEVIDLVCAAHERGGMAEARRAVNKIVRELEARSQPQAGGAQ